jgi:hypothetical protein
METSRTAPHSRRRSQVSMQRCFAWARIPETVSDAELRTITVDYTIEFARVLRSSSPDAAFSFLSGNGADPTGRSRLAFARYKGEAEKALLAAGFPRVYLFRPAYIYPVEPRKEPNFTYRLCARSTPRSGCCCPTALPSRNELPCPFDLRSRRVYRLGDLRNGGSDLLGPIARQVLTEMNSSLLLDTGQLTETGLRRTADRGLIFEGRPNCPPGPFRRRLPPPSSSRDDSSRLAAERVQRRGCRRPAIHTPSHRVQRSA